MCSPFYFIAGQGDKRKAGSEKEFEREAEGRYMRLLSAYRRTNDAAILEQLEEAFGGMSPAKQREYAEGEPCHDARDIITLDDIQDLEADNVVYIFENNLKYCYNLDALMHYLRRENISPVSRRVFTEEELARVHEAATVRVLTVWEHWRNAKDEDPLALNEWEHVLANSYSVQDHTIKDARLVRMQRHMEEIYANPTAANLFHHWGVLRNTYGAKVHALDWTRLTEIPIKSAARIFSDWADVRDFLYRVPGMRKRYWEKRAFWQAVVPRLLGAGDNPANYTDYGQEKVRSLIVKEVPAAGAANHADIVFKFPLTPSREMTMILLDFPEHTVRALRDRMREVDIPTMYTDDTHEHEIHSHWVQCWPDIRVNYESVIDEPDVETEYPPNPDREIRRHLTDAQIANPNNVINIAFMVDYNAPSVALLLYVAEGHFLQEFQFFGEEFVKAKDTGLPLPGFEALWNAVEPYRYTHFAKVVFLGNDEEETENVALGEGTFGANLVHFVYERITDNQNFGPWISDGHQEAEFTVTLKKK